MKCMHKTLLLAPIIALLIMVPALAHADTLKQIETQHFFTGYNHILIGGYVSINDNDAPYRTSNIQVYVLNSDWSLDNYRYIRTEMSYMVDGTQLMNKFGGNRAVMNGEINGNHFNQNNTINLIVREHSVILNVTFPVIEKNHTYHDHKGSLRGDPHFTIDDLRDDHHKHNAHELLEDLKSLNGQIKNLETRLASTESLLNRVSESLINTRALNEFQQDVINDLRMRIIVLEE